MTHNSMSDTTHSNIRFDAGPSRKLTVASKMYIDTDICVPFNQRIPAGRFCLYQHELIDNTFRIRKSWVDRFGFGSYRIMVNSIYGLSSITPINQQIRTIIGMGRMVNQELFSTKLVSMDFVGEYECMIVVDYCLGWFLKPEEHISIIRTTPKREYLLSNLTSKWEHGPYTMYDKTVAPLGFNDKGYPTPPCLDVLTRQKRKRKENDDDIDR